MSIDAQHPNPMDAEQLFLESDFFSDIDREFARLMSRLTGGENSFVTLAAALVSQARGEGHTCLNLRDIAATTMGASADGEIRVQLPGLEEWTEALRSAPVVGRPADFAPLILDDQSRLYLHRYWQYESNLAKSISERARLLPALMDRARLEQGLERLFPSTADADQSQRLAAITATQRTFCVITCPANELVADIHDRMPVIIPPESYDHWLSTLDLIRMDCWCLFRQPQ